MKVSTDNGNNFGYEKITIVVDRGGSRGEGGAPLKLEKI
jgi:hypothetical protein